MSKSSLIAVPKGATALDVLAERYRAAFGKMEGGREQWIEGTLELAVIMAEAKFSGHREFSQWLYRHGFEHMHPNDRAALLGFSRDQQAARKMLEKSSSISWRVIWERQPKGAPTKIGKGASRKKSGAQNRSYVPEVMREEPRPSLPPPRRRLSDMGLTPEQVDPDFKGTHLEFKTKYGHVNLHTKEQIEHQKQQEVLAAWLGAVADLDRTSRAMLVALAAVNPATLQEWMHKPLKAGKMRAWCDSIQVACEAVRNLCPPLGSPP